MPRLYCPVALVSGQTLCLPASAARHVQVLRLQPGDPITLFDGCGGEYAAVIAHMGRSEVKAVIGAHHAIERETQRAVHLALGVPANERMDWLVEKATELGAASIQPLVSTRAVVRLGEGERLQKKLARWHAIAAAACEQCGRNRLPQIHPVADFSRWIAVCAEAQAQHTPQQRLLLSVAPHCAPLMADRADHAPVLLLSGPEGGLSAAEETLALTAGFVPVSLGARVLRAETAALAALARMAL